MLSGSRRKELGIKLGEVGTAREKSRGPDRIEPVLLLGRQTNQLKNSKNEGGLIGPSKPIVRIGRPPCTSCRTRHTGSPVGAVSHVAEPWDPARRSISVDPAGLHAGALIRFS